MCLTARLCAKLLVPALAGLLLACNMAYQVPGDCVQQTPDWPQVIMFSDSVGFFAGMTVEESRPLQVSLARSHALAALLDSLKDLSYNDSLTFRQEDSVRQDRSLSIFLAQQADSAVQAATIRYLADSSVELRGYYQTRNLEAVLPKCL